MAKFLFHPFFMMLAAIVNTELQEQIKYLKVENRILRSKLGKRVKLTPDERSRLVRFGAPLGPALKDLISIVTYQTFRRWVNGNIYKGKKGTDGRPAIPGEVRNLIIQMALDNPTWGYKRIRGELKKLGIEVCRASIQNILREVGLEPTPLRQDSTWKKFIETHMATLIACDFFTKEIWTLRGKVTLYVFFFIELGTRRVHLAGMTRYPKQEWVERRAKEVLGNIDESGFKPQYLIRDRDCKFSDDFDKLWEERGVEIKKTPVKNPSCNVFAERFVWSAKHEALNHFVVFGKEHLKYIVESYVDYYNRLRPHQGLGNVPIPGLPQQPDADGDIECVSILGGLLHHYQREAA
jgi:putative transposase